VQVREQGTRRRKNRLRELQKINYFDSSLTSQQSSMEYFLLRSPLSELYWNIAEKPRNYFCIYEHNK
jgi:hypothetical protein